MPTIELSQAGAPQAALFAALARTHPLPANAAQYPLGSGQFYGQIATNCRLVNSKAGSNRGLSARNHHRTRGPVTEIAMVLPNWYVDRSASKLEYPNNAGTICAASIEYPAGVFHRLTFDGAVRELIPGGGFRVSAFVPIAIPNDAEFWSNIWCSAGSTVLFFNGTTAQVGGNGEKATVSTGDVTDFTMTSHTGSAQSYGIWPLALIGRTSAKTSVILSDSIGEGVGDVSDSTDHVGMLARLIGPSSAYTNLSQSGDRLELLLQSHSKRLALLGYARNAVLGMGVNDIGAGRSLAQIKTDLVTLWAKAKAALATGGRVFQTTITPSTTSTDNFASLANQSPASNFSIAGNGTRELLNDWLRDGAPLLAGNPAAIGTAGALRSGAGTHPLHAIIEMADAVESARNSRKWRVDGTAGKWTSDGIHPSSYAHKEAALATTGSMSLFA